MIVDRDAATVSSDLTSCTFEHMCYECTLDKKTFKVYDTAGLNDGDQGRIPHWKALEYLYTLIRQLNSVSLLIYCFRGRITQNTQANWNLFNEVVFKEQVPIILVVTCLEHETDWDDLARLKRTKEAFEAYGMKPKEVTLIISSRGKQNEYADLYQRSQAKLRTLVKGYHRVKPWSMGKDEWSERTFEKLSTSLPSLLPVPQ